MDLQTELSLADGQCPGAMGPEPDTSVSSKDDLWNSKSDQLEQPKKENESCQEAEKKKRKRNRNRKRKKSQFQNLDQLPSETHSENVLCHNTGSFDEPVAANALTKEENESHSPPVEVVFDYTRHALEIEAHLMSLEQSLDYGRQLFPLESKESILSGAPAVPHPSLDVLQMPEEQDGTRESLSLLNKAEMDPSNPNGDTFEIQEELQEDKHEFNIVGHPNLDAFEVPEILQDLDIPQPELDPHPSFDELLDELQTLDKYESELDPHPSFDELQELPLLDKYKAEMDPSNPNGDTFEIQEELQEDKHEFNIVGHPHLDAFEVSEILQDLDIPQPELDPHPSLDELQEELPLLDKDKSEMDPSNPNLDTFEIQGELQQDRPEFNIVDHLNFGALQLLDILQDLDIPQPELDPHPSFDELQELALLDKYKTEMNLSNPNRETFGVQEELQDYKHEFNIVDHPNLDAFEFLEILQDSDIPQPELDPHPSLDELQEELPLLDKDKSEMDPSNPNLDIFEIQWEFQQDNYEFDVVGYSKLDAVEILRDPDISHPELDSHPSFGEVEEELQTLDTYESEMDPDPCHDALRKLVDRNRFEYEWPALGKPVYAETSEIKSERKSRSLGRRITNGIRTVLPCMAPRKMGLGLRARDSLECLQPIDSGTEKNGVHGSKKKDINLPKNLKLFGQQ